MKKYPLFLPTLFALGVLAIKTVYGLNGPALTGIGPLQQATVGAGATAKPEDSAAAITNPAALTIIDERIDVSIQYLGVERSFTAQGDSTMANTAAGTVKDSTSYWLPAVGGVKKWGEGTLGLGLFPIGGAGVDYEKSRTVPGAQANPTYDRRSKYQYLRGALSYALPIGEGMSVGAGLNMNYALLKFDALVPDGTGVRQISGANKKDDAFGGGVSVGFLKSFERCHLGASYISRQWMERFDDYPELASSLDTPQQFQFGVAFEATPEVDLLLDYKFIDWESVKAFSNEPTKGGLGWKNQSVISFGGRWRATEKLTFRGGLNYGKSPVDEEHIFANILTPVIMEWHVGTGASYKVNDHSVVHLTYQHTFRENKQESGSGGAFSQVGKGSKLSAKVDSISLGYSYLF